MKLQNQKLLIINQNKLIQVSESFKLYNLLNDPFETKDIASKNEEILKRIV